MITNDNFRALQFCLLSGRFKSKETDSVHFITKIHISRYVDSIFMFFMSKNSQNSVVLEYVNHFFLLAL